MSRHQDTREKGQRLHVLYGLARDAPQSQRGHAGLVFEKYPSVWWVEDGANGPKHDSWDTTRRFDKQRRDGAWREESEPLTLPFLKTFCEQFHKRPEMSNALLAAVHRRQCLLRELLHGNKLELETQWRFVTGMGTAHPIENGFTFDRAVGVPYLPGSSVKGVARAGAEYARDNAPDEARWRQIDNAINEVFGPEGDAARTMPAAGAVIFFDAYPTEWPRLEPDIMNPHYGKYYREESPPADYLEPNPVFFLTVAARARFRFVLAPRLPQYVHHLEAAEQWLKVGLEVLGAGAKTAVGYGHFSSG